MSYPNRGGRVPPDNRPAAAPGVGKNSKRHDLERRDTPYLHDSDLQQGDVQAMEDGQRIAPRQTQRPAAPVPSGSQGSGTTPDTSSTGAADVPDAIDFIAGLTTGNGVNPPQGSAVPSAHLDMWVRFAKHLVNGPGSSGLLAGAYINQMRQLRSTPQIADSVLIDLADVDAALAAALDEEENAGPRG